ncbi:hypothetical protein AB6N23_01955 [Cellulomonas sp. 179-A 9B4 NHS]|uniref:hypothetical protein n=1 Tax=Cellulomonas sp. 179-A 9B4 NHS TaxID=3142379 RepID=UPI0039A3A89C
MSYAALLLSAGSLLVAALAYRAGGPRLRLHSYRIADSAPTPFPRGVPVELTVVNSGRAAVTIEGFHVTHPEGRRPLAHVRDAHGPDLPHRLDAHSSATWIVDALPAARAVEQKSGGQDDMLVGPAQFRFVVRAGNGQEARESYSYTAVRFIAEAGRRD